MGVRQQSVKSVSHPPRHVLLLISSVPSQTAEADGEPAPPAPPISVQFIKPYLSLIAVAKCLMTVGATFFGGGSQLALVIASAAMCVLLLVITLGWAHVALPHIERRPVSHGFVAPSASMRITVLRMLGFAGGVWGACVGAIAVSAVAWTLEQQLIAVAAGVGAMLLAMLVAFRTQNMGVAEAKQADGGKATATATAALALQMDKKRD
jgi:hypothetical protein